MRPPVLVSGAQMRNSPDIARQFHVLKLRYRDLEGLSDASHTGVSGSLLCPGDLLQEIAPKWVIRSTYRTVRLTNQLRHDVQVSDGSEEGGKLAKRQIHVDLFQVGLR